jgi:hypothetical protein
VLDNVANAGLSPCLVGFYATEVRNLYDTVGPFAMTVYSSVQRPSTIAGIGVDPLFVQAYVHAQSVNTSAPIVADVVRDPNDWTTLVNSPVIQVAVYLFTILFSISFAFGCYLLLKPLVLYVRARKAGLSVGQAFQPHLAGVMGVLCMFTLLSRAIHFHYKSPTLVDEFFYRFGILTTVLAYCLLLHRWTLIVEEIRASVWNRILRFLAILIATSGTVGTVLQWVADTFLFSEGFVYGMQKFLDFGIVPVVIVMSFLFLVLAVRLLLLIKKRKLLISRESNESMKRLTLYGLLFWLTTIVYFAQPFAIAVGAPTNPPAYILVRYLSGFVFWSVNTAVLYIWAKRVFATDKLIGDTRTIDVDQDEYAIQLSTNITSLHTAKGEEKSLVDSSADWNQADQWNHILLYSNAHVKPRTTQNEPTRSLDRQISILITDDSAVLEGTFGGGKTSFL